MQLTYSFVTESEFNGLNITFCINSASCQSGYHKFSVSLLKYDTFMGLWFWLKN